MSAAPPPVRVALVDPSAYTPAYDHALAAALARAGARVELLTSRFAYGEVAEPEGYAVSRLFYRRASGRPGSRTRQAAKLASHLGDMRALRRVAGARADVIHLQWVAVPWLDVHLLPPGPLVLTVHNASPRSRRPGLVRAQRAVFDRVDALVVHSEYGRVNLVDRFGVLPSRIHVIPHGAFAPGPAGALPPELTDDGRPVVLLFGLIRPYKGIATLLDAWEGIAGAQLWIVGRPMMALPRIPAGVTVVPRYVSEPEAAAVMQRADVITLPYEQDDRIDQSGVLAGALGAGRATVVSSVGGLAEVARTGAVRGVPPGDAVALRDALTDLIGDPAARARLGEAARQAAAGPYSWDAAAARTLALYASLRTSRGAVGLP